MKTWGEDGHPSPSQVTRPGAHPSLTALRRNRPCHLYVYVEIPALFSPNSVSPSRSQQHCLLLYFKSEALEADPLLLRPCPALSASQTRNFPFHLDRNLDVPSQLRAKTSLGALGLLTLFLPGNSPPWLNLKSIAPLKITYGNHARLSPSQEAYRQ